MNYPSPLAKLKADWPSLHDLDRATAVRSLNKSGMSVRKIASNLKVSESLLRHLVIALDASAEDRVLARQGKISTNELVKRSKVAKQRRADKIREETTNKQEDQAQTACAQICRWLVSERIFGGNAEQVIDEVRLHLFWAESQGRLNQPMKKPNASVFRIIELSKPKFSMDENAGFITWYAAWLYRWTVWSFVDPLVRDKALDLALQRQ